MYKILRNINKDLENLIYIIIIVVVEYTLFHEKWSKGEKIHT